MIRADEGAPAMGVDDQVALLESILESSIEYAITALDWDGIILTWSEGARRMFGYEAAEVVGKLGFQRLSEPRDVSSGRASAILEEARTVGRWSGELDRVRKDGSAFTASLTLTVRRDRAGNALGLTLIGRDLTERQQVLRALREAQEYNRSLFDASVDAVVATDPQGVITDVNRRMCELTGASRDDLIGSPFERHFTEGARAQACVDRALAEGSVTNHVLVMRAWTGRETVVSYNATTFHCTDGKLRGVLAAARDVTDQKRLEAQIQQRNEELTKTTAFLTNILETSTGYSLIVKLLDGTILAWNEGARRNYGYTAKEMIGQSSRLLHAPEDVVSGRVSELHRTALRTGKAEGVFERVRKDGTRFWAAMALTLRKDAEGQPEGYVLISKDITEERRLAEQLRRQNEALADQNRRVQEANRKKSEFLANMSHELRTPLNGIIGFAELLHDERVGPVSAEQKEFLGDVLTSARHLHRLINDVLDLAKVEAGKMTFYPEPLDLARVVGEVRDILRTLAASKNIRVGSEVDPSLDRVLLDPAKLKQVLYNYLSNALKFTPDGGRVTLRARPDGPRAIHLEVEDTGIGIPAAHLGRLFVEFEQLDASSSKSFQGTGLGLALTRRIVEAQGGRVQVRSEPGRGSTFSAFLPLGEEESPRTPTPAPARFERAGGARVLVIEDDCHDRTRIVEALGRAHYAVEVAATGAEALECLASRRFDAITLDLLLPDMNGWDVLRALRATGPNEETPVVVVTMVAEKSAAMGFLIRDFLGKPLQPATLLAALERAGVKPSDRRTVLLVDDDPAAGKLLSMALAERGYHLVHAPGAMAGLRAATADPPGVVLLDLLMPDVNGFEFLNRFRLTEAGRTTPVIVWTMKDLTPEERAVLRESAQAVVPKGDDAMALLMAELGALISGNPRAGSVP